ncbi:MAG: hypothetical protein AAB620_00340 [Patescibacteria group bacterium]
MTFLSKLIFLITRPQVIAIVDTGEVSLAKNIYKMLKARFGAIVIEFGREKSHNKNKAEEFKFFLRKSTRSILIINDFGDISLNDISKIIVALPPAGRLILNYDKEAIRQLKGKSSSQVLTFGLAEQKENLIGPELQASDIRFTDNGLTFKLNYRGSSVPIWLANSSSREDIYPVLAGIGAGVSLNVNLVELSRVLSADSP